ncbi:D-inositol-3-phosphate glycosyltransferase [Paraoerskovia marina]|uniref:D-inositol-3-phosphate glycosyltransferase n=1 Tax=Paraoerskovia marina TaxID=545619 RepID=A0A1H1PZ90_9CELL|nr:D-inositol-3-phosphate glycosyltransferase [Paraoerskovia marina]SDS16436.1 D-inositol-3-phosphate glycosyltransferase [Paraoerskovia marina]
MDLAAPGRPVRVAMICVHTSPLDRPGSGDAGGMNVYVLELARALAARGAAVEIFTRATSSSQPPCVEVEPGVVVRHVPAGPFEGLDKNDLPGQLCAFAAGLLRAEAGRERGWYDVVHSHYWLSGEVGWLVADRWDVPLVHTMHTMARVKNAALAPGDVPEPAGRIIGEEQVTAEADALIASTAAEADDLVREYDADPAQVHVVPPGVDLQTFAPVGPGREAVRAHLGACGAEVDDAGLVVFAGRVQALKAPDVLVRALGVMRAAGEPVPVLAILGGASGRPTAVRELEALAAVEGVADRVVVLPPVDRAELATWFRAADIVAVPSHNESFGLVAAEASACGTPVVAASVGGLRTIVVDDVSGVLVPDHEPVTWAAEIGALLGDPERRARLGAGAVQVAQQFGWDRTAQGVLDAYSAALDARASFKLVRG